MIGTLIGVIEKEGHASIYTSADKPARDESASSLGVYDKLDK